MTTGILSGLRQMSISSQSNSSRTIAAGATNPSTWAALRRRVAAARPSDRRDKAIAAPDDRGDVSGAGLAIRQDTAQSGNTDLEIIFSDKGLRPDLRNQIRLAHDFARAFDKSDQEIEGATAERNGLVTL